MGILSVTKAAAKASKAAAKAKKAAAKIAAAKKAAAIKKAKEKKDYAAYVKQNKADEKAFAKKANTDSPKEEAYESSRSMAGTKDRTSAAAKRAKAKAKIKSQKPKTQPKKTFESELRELKSKAMTDANRGREAAKLAVKYGRTITMNGKTYGPKKKGPPISRERIPGVKRNKKGEIIDIEGT